MKAISIGFRWFGYWLALIFALPSAVTASLSTSHLANEISAISVSESNGGAIRFTSEARIGRLLDWELAMRRHPSILNDGSQVTTHYDFWLNNVPIPFVLTYDGRGTVRMTLLLATVASQHTLVGDFDELFLATRAVNPGSRIVVSNLVLDGVPVESSSSAIHTGTEAQNVLRIQGGNLADGFLLTGTITMAWTGARPTNSQLDLRIWGAKVVAAPPDTTSPTVTITAPAAGSFLGSATPEVTATFADAGSGVDTASVRLLLDGQDRTGEATVSATGLGFTPSSALADGPHTVEITVRDRAGNEGRASAGFTTDTVLPTLVFTAPPGTVSGDPTPEVAVTYSDATSGLDLSALEIALDGSSFSNCVAGPSSATCEPPPLAAGEHTASASVRDRAGNTATAAVTFDLVLDGDPPAVAIISPADGALLTTSTPLIAATFTDSGSGIDPESVELLLDGFDHTSEAEVGATGLTFTPSEPLGEGAHTAAVTVRDTAGNTSRTEVSFTTDSGAPEMTFPAPPAFVEDDPTPEIVVAFTDATSGVDPASLRVTLDGADLTPACAVSGASATCEPPPLATGAHRLNARVRDRAGNTASASAGFDLDLDDAAPALALVEPSRPLVVGDRTPTIRVEYSDPRSGIDLSSLRVVLDGMDLTSNCVLAEAAAICEPPELARGGHAVTAQVQDRRGNLATAELSFQLTLPLEIAFTEPEAETVVGVPVVRVAGTVSPDAVSVRVNGVEATLQGGTFAIDGLGLHDGVNDLVAVAMDAQGNVGTATVRVTADTTPPALSVQTPGDGAVVHSAEVAVAGRVNDLTIGTVSETEVTVTVNGTPAAVAHRSFLLTGVRLSPGPNLLEVVATDRAGNRAMAALTVTFEPRAGGPALQAVSGNGQSAPVLTRLADPLVVRVTDAAGQPLGHTRVVFRVVQGSGTLGNGKRSQVIATNAQGEATALLTLGSRAGVGVDRVRSTAVGVPGEVVFLASASPAAPAAIDVASGDEQLGAVGTPLARPFVAVVTDGHQNPLGGVPVTFRVVEGEGLLDGGESVTVETNASGLASALLTLGASPGMDNNVVEASFEGMTVFPATFRASGLLAGDPAETRIAGAVLDNQGEPVPGVTLRLRDSTLTAVTNEHGHFQLSGVPVGQVFLIADATTATRPGAWASLEFELFTVAGTETTLPRPIYILPLDQANGLLVDETHGGILTLPEVPGFSLEIAPGSVTFPGGSRSGVVSVTAVHADKIPMAPGAGMQPRVIVTIQPAGALFDPPARITFPNVDALPPGTVTELFSFDHDIGSFVAIGTGTVSEDGLVLRSDPGFGVLEAGWHCGAIVGPNGQTANVKIETTTRPIVLVADQNPPDHIILGSRGEPPLDSVYAWLSDNTRVATLNPSGVGLCPDALFCNTELTAVGVGEATATAGILCTTTGKTDEKQVKVYVADVDDVIVHPSDPETYKTQSIVGSSSQLLHFVTAINQGDVILQAKVLPDVPEVRNAVSWESPSGSLISPAVGNDKTTAKLSSNTITGLKVPVTIRIAGKPAQEIVIWVVSADVNGSISAPIVTPQFGGGFRIGTRVKCEIKPKAAIQPPSILSDADRPDLTGPNAVPPPGGVSTCNNSLSGGANARWDISRRIAVRSSVNPARLLIECVDFTADLPADPLIGNDDAGVNDPEDNDPYTDPDRGFLVGFDDPHREGPGNGLMRNGDVGDTYRSSSWFQEFARLQLGGARWYLISSPLEWRVDFAFTKKPVTESLWNADLNGDGDLADDVTEQSAGRDINGDGDANDVVSFWDESGTVCANDNAGRP